MKHFPLFKLIKKLKQNKAKKQPTLLRSDEMNHIENLTKIKQNQKISKLGKCVVFRAKKQNSKINSNSREAKHNKQNKKLHTHNCNGYT